MNLDEVWIDGVFKLNVCMCVCWGGVEGEKERRTGLFMTPADSLSKITIIIPINGHYGVMQSKMCLCL